MKVSIPIYVVTLFVAFVLGAIKAWNPDIPITADLIQYLILAVLTALGVDVTQAFLRVQAQLKSLLANLKGQKII